MPVASHSPVLKDLYRIFSGVESSFWAFERIIRMTQDEHGYEHFDFAIAQEMHGHMAHLLCIILGNGNFAFLVILGIIVRPTNGCRQPRLPGVGNRDATGLSSAMMFQQKTSAACALTNTQRE